MTRETKLGLFVMAGLFGLILSIILLGDFQFQSRYYINVLFDDVASLPTKAKVKIAGVEVGGVTAIELQETKAKVRLWIRRDIKIHRDAEANIVSTGIIGSKYLELTMGSPGAPLLNDGDVINGTNPVSLERMLGKAMEKLEVLVSSISGPEMKNFGSDLGMTMSNLRQITETLRLALDRQETKMAEIIDNIHSFSEDIASLTEENKENITASIREIRKASENIARIAARIDSGEGMLGKLVSDKEMGEELKSTVTDIRETSKEARRALKRINLIETRWNYKLRYDGKYKLYRYDVGLRVIPGPGKYYYVGASNAGELPAGTIDPELRTTLDFLIGRNYKAVGAYAGAIRSKGGVGVAVRPLWKWEPLRRLEVKAEAYNFSRTVPVNMPKINVAANIDVTPGIAVGTQLDDVYSESNLNTYVHVEFKDEDIAYVLGVVGLAR